MSKLVKLSMWRKERFVEGQAPSRPTCIKAIEDGQLPGKKIGKHYYVDIDSEREASGNACFDLIMKHP